MWNEVLNQLSDPIAAVVVAVVLVILAAMVRSWLLRIVLFGGGVATLAWMATNFSSQQKPGENILAGIERAGVVKTLESPLFALAVAVLLAFIGSQAGWRVVKLVAFCGATAAVVWAATTNASVGTALTATVQTFAQIILWLLFAVTVICVTLIIAVVIMYLSPVGGGSRRSPHLRRPLDLPDGGHFDPAQLDDPDLDHDDRFVKLAGHVVTLVTDAAPDLADEESLPHIVREAIRFYFSGLSPHMKELRSIHAACNREIGMLAAENPSGPEAAELRRMARARVYLPDRADWQALCDELDLTLPYPAMRLLLLKRDWREVATIFHKCVTCSSLFQDPGLTLD